MLLDNWDQEEILDSIKGNDFTSAVLVSNECWKTICSVRCRNLGQIDDEEWKALCATRGYLLSRQNSRGF